MSADQTTDSACQGTAEPKAFVIWNHQLASMANSNNSTSESFANFSFVYEPDSSGFSSLSAGEIIPISELPEDDELECFDVNKEPAYNIVQSKMNLNEKRGPKYLCRECRYPMHTRLSMITHMKMHLKPFCEVCFATFESKDIVHRHIGSAHPEVVIRDRTPPPSSSMDYYYLQTIAPPNTPNPISDDEMRTIEGLVNPIVKLPVNAAAVHKLLGQEDTDGGVSTEDEHRLVIDDRPPRPVAIRGRPKKKPAVLKRQLKKKSNKGKINEVAKPDNILKKITSRFGRAISLKIPQYY